LKKSTTRKLHGVLLGFSARVARREQRVVHRTPRQE
jgi:hypothetical protein